MECFRKAGFSTKKATSQQPVESDEEIMSLFTQTKELLPGDQTLQIDNDIAATEEMTLQEIAAKEHNDTEQVDCDDQPEEDAPETVTNKKAEEAMETLRLFLQQQEGAGDILSQLTTLETSIGKLIASTKKQSSITSFFQTNAKKVKTTIRCDSPKPTDEWGRKEHTYHSY
ncbi:hypothetical protein PoB_002933000 [Plakobranchus ocellatus]|uniref:Uncharacterized protein n=1 Tax=Plakobranchus ocellatus TaxID=259542 RepID=A0AAV4A624_9GAST|nr:hypothetical protein PoB_002933000 [Plakobranchus ocellatus]